ncbi:MULTISPECIES: hypothetical protein [unclassified Pseudomonas]|uniref:hypothetical protein n=1 Tax=unclassified Pseudomonas TaxID=196821 RepID=UPI002115AD1B|nr:MULTISPECIES: hypothetical protein [unclassified Pseudomonas]
MTPPLMATAMKKAKGLRRLPFWLMGMKAFGVLLGFIWEGFVFADDFLLGF